MWTYLQDSKRAKEELLKALEEQGKEPEVTPLCSSRGSTKRTWDSHGFHRSEEQL